MQKGKHEGDYQPGSKDSVSLAPGPKEEHKGDYQNEERARKK